MKARGTGYRQSKVKVATALKVTPKNDTRQKKAKKESSSAGGLEEAGEYFVERILGSLIGEKGKIWYLIKWEGELPNDQLKQFLKLETFDNLGQTNQ